MELKANEGIKKNMVSEIETLENKAYKAGFNDAEKQMKARAEKGKAALRGEGVCLFSEAIRRLVEYTLKHEELKGTLAEAKANILDTIIESCPFSILEAADEISEEDAEKDKQYAPEVGDIVLDPTGNRCTVTNTDTHIHVVYENGKTHKWGKGDKFIKVGEAMTAEVKDGKIIGFGSLGKVKE